MKVILNRWLGGKYENSTVCNICNRLGSVVQFNEFNLNGLPGGRVCSNCLMKAQQSIQSAFLANVRT